ncbi:hypothetical protein ACHAWO_010712 [Cyclotella atomus]|uniref:Calmodulin-lysine N-methyltransferase n=1 Tax=Cyclotella atomus TaxID=382360 RepID=A0ABD3Q070_9STRA
MTFAQSPSNHLPINYDLECDEEFCPDDFESPFRLHITLPRTLKPAAAGKRLTFHSRERSTGTGVVTSNDKTTDLETIHDGPLDPHFFQKGFYLEAKTGFQVWPGSRLLLQALLCELDDAPSEGSAFTRLKYWQDRLLRSSTPLNILELGGGIGAVGGSLAAAGANVLMTDLNVLVNHGMGPNLIRLQSSSGDCAAFFPFLTSMLPAKQSEDNIVQEPIVIGCGCARPTVLDWFKPVSEQLSHDACNNVDLIVACDCIFLRKIVDPMFNAVAEIFRNAKRSEEVTCLFTYQRRNLMGVFITLEEVLDKIAKRGWSVQCLAWRKVVVEDDGEHDLYLFEISSKGQQEALRNDVESNCEEKKES